MTPLTTRAQCPGLSPSILETITATLFGFLFRFPVSVSCAIPGLDIESNLAPNAEQQDAVRAALTNFTAEFKAALEALDPAKATVSFSTSIYPQHQGSKGSW